MGLQIMYNVVAYRTANTLGQTNTALQKTFEQLASGSKINNGSDDAGGLELVRQCQANQQALSQSQNNLEAGAGFLRVADGALQQTTNLLNRAISLATQASNGTLTQTQLSSADLEYQAILAEIDNLGTTTTYNQEKVFGLTVDVYRGDASKGGASLDVVKISALSASSIGETNGQISYTLATASNVATLQHTASSGADLSGTNLLTHASALTAAISLSAAIGDVSAQDEYLGSQINLMSYEGAIASAQLTSIAAAQNAMEATDYAAATSALSRGQVLMQAGISALSQATSAQNEVSKLIAP